MSACGRKQSGKRTGTDILPHPMKIAVVLAVAAWWFWPEISARFNPPLYDCTVYLKGNQFADLIPPAKNVTLKDGWMIWQHKGKTVRQPVSEGVRCTPVEEENP